MHGQGVTLAVMAGWEWRMGVSGSFLAERCMAIDTQSRNLNLIDFLFDVVIWVVYSICIGSPEYLDS